MAFATVLSDFFSCGRARKTRESQAEPLDENDATSEPATQETVEAAAPALSLALAPIPALTLDEKATDEVEARPRAGGPEPTNTQQLDVEPALHGESAAEDKVELSVVQEKAKSSSGWMVEQRVLVTAMRAAAPKEAETTTSVLEPETEFNTITPPVRCATPEMKPWISTSIARPVIPEAQIVDVAPVQDAAIVVEPVVEQPAISEPEVSSTAPEELVAPVPEPKVQAAKRITPLTFLSMPPEIRNKIYEQMNENGPIRMCRADDSALVLRDGESARAPRRQFYNLTQVCQEIRNDFLPVYANKTEYIIDLWGQRAHLAEVESLKAKVSMDIDAACFDMEPIDLLPLLQCLVRIGRTDFRFTSTEGVVFRSISEIVAELNKLLPAANGSNQGWFQAVNGPMKRIDLHLFPHDDIRQYYRFRGAEPLVRIVYPTAKSEEWMKRASKSEGYEAYLRKTGLDKFEMHVVIGHASRRTTNEGRLPLDWRMSYPQPRQSVDRARLSMDVAAARMSLDRSPRT